MPRQRSHRHPDGDDPGTRRRSAGRASARDEPKGPRAEVTIKGNVLCNRATDRKPWFWDPKDGDHTPIIYAVEGTPAIAERVRKIMESYPDRGLDVEDALRIQDQFTKHLKYFLAPGPIAAKIHKDVEAGSQIAGPDRDDLREGREAMDHRHPV